MTDGDTTTIHNAYATVAREVSRRLRENVARSDEAKLRELSATTIEQLVEQSEAQARLIFKFKKMP